ncbi:MAG: hypothetical protein D6785_01325 [Planctomycetota bacterium]|nr:MAG: hypothetical protein D6785_01325 [Planctomycetota bacterium]
MTSKEEMVKALAPEVLEKWQKEWKKEGETRGEKRGEKRGAIKKAQEDILRFLEARFESVSPKIEEKVRNTQDIKKLDELVVAAAKCQSLEEFETAL